MTEWCRIWISHVAQKGVISYVNKSYHTPMTLRHDSFICDTTLYLNKSYHTPMPHMNTSCRAWKYVMLHRRESYHTWLSRITHDGVMSHKNRSCRAWMSRVMHEWVMSHVSESCRIWMSHVAQGGVISYANDSCHIWMSRVTPKWVVLCVNELCYKYIIRFWLFWHRFEVNTSRHILVMLNMDCSTSPPTRWSFLGVVQSQEAGGTDCNETLVTRLN